MGQASSELPSQKDIHALKSEFLRRVEVARQSPTPAWVKGPRPSDECIATREDHGDPLGEEIHKLDLAGMMETRKVKFDTFPSDEWAPVPTSYKAEEVNANGVRCYWANWPGIDIHNGVLLYIHGGAMVTGHPDVDWCAHLSRATGKAILTVDYRMAPEHPMPAATEDIVAVYRWLVEHEVVSPRRIALYGRSSGGMLVVLALQAIVRQSLPPPACGVPVSLSIPHFTQRELWEVVVGNIDANGQSTGKNNSTQDARFNCLAGSFSGLPPLYIMVGGEEHVDRDLNASKRVAKASLEAGVQTELDIVHHMQHCPDNFLGYVPEATQAVARAAKFIDAMMGENVQA